MRFSEVEGDIIKLAKENKFDGIAHGCNLQNIMGAGLALQIKNNFPEAYYADTMKLKKHLGELSEVDLFKENFSVKIFNCYTQIGLGGQKKLNGLLDLSGTLIKVEDSYEVRLVSIRECFRKINKKMKGKHLAIPKIGAGLAGGDWSKIKKIALEELKDLSNLTIVYYKKKGEK